MSTTRDFGFESTTHDVLQGIDLDQQTAVVTGASGGLGAETARALASKGAAVVIACRDRSRGEERAAEIRASTGNTKVSVEPVDLLDEASIRDFAQRVSTKHPAIQILINNAGLMGCALLRSTQGWELQFATNHMGHFLLTNLLAPTLLNGAPARIVNLSSGGHVAAGVDFEDLHYEHKPYEKWEAYGQAKSANALFAVALDRRLRDRGVAAFSVHPGAIPTDLGRHLEKTDLGDLMTAIDQVGGLKSIEQGAATSVWAATAPELDGQGGLYLEDCRPSGPVGTPGITSGYLPHAVDPEAAERLWKVSEELWGQTFAV